MRRRFIMMQDDEDPPFMICNGMETNRISCTSSLLYKREGGTWETLNAGDDLTLNKRESVSFCAEWSRSANFTIENKCHLKGNIMSLVFGHSYKGQLNLKTSLSNLFAYCATITTAAELLLPATTLSGMCYAGMFQGCTSLKVAPKLPATALANGCYISMFEGCTSLVGAPELPATTLVNSCYASMFKGCTSLMRSPDLTANTLEVACYSEMFQGCSNLSIIRALFTSKPGGVYTGDWVDGVSSSGTFYKSKSATWDNRGVNAVPEGWSIYKE